MAYLQVSFQLKSFCSKKNEWNKNWQMVGSPAILDFVPVFSSPDSELFCHLYWNICYFIITFPQNQVEALFLNYCDSIYRLCLLTKHFLVFGILTFLIPCPKSYFFTKGKYLYFWSLLPLFSESCFDKLFIYLFIQQIWSECLLCVNTVWGARDNRPIGTRCFLSSRSWNSAGGRGGRKVMVSKHMFQ